MTPKGSKCEALAEDLLALPGWHSGCIPVEDVPGATYITASEIKDDFESTLEDWYMASLSLRQHMDREVA